MGSNKSSVREMENALREDDGSDSAVLEASFTGKENQESPKTTIEAPAIISERAKSDPPKPPESGDIEYLTFQEIKLGEQVNTIDVIHVPDPTIDAETWLGPWTEVCVGRNPQSGKMQVARIPARERRVPPNEMVQYLGSVIQDHQAVHSTSINYKGRHGFVFDRFYNWNGEKLPRCCWVPDHTYQAGLIFEKCIHYRTRKPFARIRRRRAGSIETNEPMYRVLIPKSEREGYYRDLKRLFDRYFLTKEQETLAEDIGLKILIDGMA